MPEPTAFLVNFAVLLVAASLLVASARSVALLWRSRLESPEVRRVVPWRGSHVLAIALISLSLQPTLPYLFGFRHPDEATENEQFTAPQARALLASAIASNLLTFGIGVVLLRSSVGATREDFGTDTEHLKSDIGLGIKAALAVIPAVYVVQAILSHWVTGKHPIETLIREYPEPSIVGLSTFAAVIAAPIGEEFFFRVVFQGWLERFWPVGPTVEELPPIVDGEIDAPTSSLNETALLRNVSWAPIVISASVFSLLHLGWPGGEVRSDPIPLFLLSVVLGYVYQRTHRIWPSLVVHLFLNGLTMLLLAIGIAIGAE
jgi:membrane protease YdiL (CAAX protease family)